MSTELRKGDHTVVAHKPSTITKLKSQGYKVVGGEPAESGRPTSVKDILKAVGDDQALAQAYLDEELAKPADDQRSSLVEKLEAVVNAGDEPVN